VRPHAEGEGDWRDRLSFRLGETMTGVVLVPGGAVEQRISELRVLLMMKTFINGQEVTRPVESIPVTGRVVKIKKQYKDWTLIEWTRSFVTPPGLSSYPFFP